MTIATSIFKAALGRTGKVQPMSFFQIGDERPTCGGEENGAQSDDLSKSWQGAGQLFLGPPNPADVAATRRAAQANDYTLVAVKTGGKRPIEEQWQLNGSPDSKLYPPQRTLLNTGVVTGRVLGVDIDHDNPVVVTALRDAALRHMGAAPCRGRSNSPRILLPYRAASLGMRKKQIGTKGAQVEVLGTGQQFVAYGLHESGVPYRWENDKGPHNTPLSDLPVVTEAQIDGFLEEVGRILANGLQLPAANGGIARLNPPLPWANRPSIFDGRSNLPNLNAAAQAGLEARTWFDDLSTDDKNAFLRKTAAHPAMVAFADQERAVWLRLLFALADAERRGATEAKEIAREWSQTSRRYNEAEFERDWRSFR